MHIELQTVLPTLYMLKTVGVIHLEEKVYHLKRLNKG